MSIFHPVKKYRKLDIDSKIGCWAISGVALLCIVIGCIFWLTKSPTYSTFTNASTPAQATRLREKYDGSDKLEYDYTYLKGCAHCNAMAPAVVPRLKNIQRHDNLLVYNSNHHDGSQYDIKSDIYNFPTVSVRYKGYLIYQYSGMRKIMFRKILNGIDPANGKRFKKSIPRTATITNTYTHSTTQKPSSSTLI